MRNIGTSKATDSDALLEGKVYLQKQLLDMKGKVILAKRHSEELAQKAEVMKALYNAENRVVLPITLTGKAKKPVASLDTEYVLGADLPVLHPARGREAARAAGVARRETRGRGERRENGCSESCLRRGEWKR